MDSTKDETLNSVLPLEAEHRRLFFELGTVAANNLMGIDALFLFMALEKCEPQEAYPKVGLGMVHLLTGDFSGAQEYLSSPEAQNSPLAGSANTMLALVHKLNGNQSGFAAASLAVAEKSPNGEYNQVIKELEAASLPLTA